MCDKAIDINVLLCLILFPINIRLKINDKIVSEDPFQLKYCHDSYKTQELCNKVVDNFLPALKFVPGWFATSKMIIKKLVTALFADDNILYFNEDSGDAIFSCDEMHILSVDLNNINLEDTNYDEDDLETIIRIRLFAWHIKFEKRKALEK